MKLIRFYLKMNNFNEENLANVIEKMTQEINVAKGELGILEKK